MFYCNFNHLSCEGRKNKNRKSKTLQTRVIGICCKSLALSFQYPFSVFRKSVENDEETDQKQ